MKKDIILWLAVSALVMLALPWLSVTFVKSDAGMAVSFLLFFAVDPLYSVIIGACAGSTGGGLKISRVIILVKSFILEIRQIINPKEIVTVRLNGKPVDKKTLGSTRIYAAAYLLLICVFTLVVSLDGFDLTTNLTAVLSCFNNIGPGLNMVGPVQNFSIYSDWAQVVLSIAMLTGRLEIFPMFLLFAKSAHDK